MEKFNWPLLADKFKGPINQTNFLIDRLWESHLEDAIGDDSIIFVGKRGSGKTMLLKYAFNHLLVNFEKERRLPVFISFSAFLADFSFPRLGEFSSNTREIARDLFKSYFHLMILNQIIEVINESDFKPICDFKLIGKTIKRKKKIDPEIVDNIREKMESQFCPREILRDFKDYKDFKIGFSSLGAKFGESESVQIKYHEFKILESEKEIRKGLEEIVKAFDLNQIVLFFDETPGLGYLQSDFFDLLYIFRNVPSTSFKIAAYPYYTDKGKYFDVPDDADEVSLDRKIFQPNKDTFYKFFQDLLCMILKVDENQLYEEKIEREALKILSIASGGNPRLFLTYFKKILKNTDFIKFTSFEEVIDDIYTIDFIKFLKRNSKRYNIVFDKCIEILNVLIQRLSNRNRDYRGNTSFIGISRKFYSEFEKEMNLLDYCRILEFIDEKTLSGKLGSGKRYNLNLVVSAANKCFKYGKNISQKIIKSLTKDLEDMKTTDRKTIIDKVGDFKLEIDIKKDEIDYVDPMERSIIELDFTDFINERLQSVGLDTIEKIYKCEINDIIKIHRIGQKKAANIKARVKEYVSDNFI